MIDSNTVHPLSHENTHLNKNIVNGKRNSTISFIVIAFSILMEKWCQETRMSLYCTQYNTLILYLSRLAKCLKRECCVFSSYDSFSLKIYSVSRGVGRSTSRYHINRVKHRTIVRKAENIHRFRPCNPIFLKEQYYWFPCSLVMVSSLKFRRKACFFMTSQPRDWPRTVVVIQLVP